HGTEENAVLTEGGVVISYWDRKRDSTMQLSAERAVIFLAPGPLPDLARAGAESVRGMYLEGDVVADMLGPEGHFTVRSPRVFYSIKDNRAVLIDAVFWTYDARRGLPLYVRAKTIEQESASQFKATRALLTSSAFNTPDLAIGVSSVTIRPDTT